MEKKTKKVKRKKLSLKKLLLLILFLYLIISIIYYIFTLRIKNIYIENNKYVSDNEIITLAKIKDYPAMIKINNHNIKKKLKNNQLIKDVKVKKNIFGKLTIHITENRPLYTKGSVTVLENGLEIENCNIKGIPELTSIIDNKLEKKLQKHLKEIKQDNLNLISEIEYLSDSLNVGIDKERFLAYMDDGNRVYFNLLNIKNLNLYPKINSSLENVKGYLYLDSSNNENFIFTPY